MASSTTAHARRWAPPNLSASSFTSAVVGDTVYVDAAGWGPDFEYRVESFETTRSGDCSAMLSSSEEEAEAAIHTLRVVRRRVESRERALPDAARPEESAVAHAAEEGKGKGEGEGEGEGKG